ncbi:ATP-grasp domain-containing protein [Solwaraspora sp. WMMD1047]|uniref:ATP-grasp domain-containing protein n=1 Tax=Solwaraspora sp. WMMD1047 TaxID=3016102 RepID=UPI002417CD2A|nr:ATP-grasp domain-containing protein [Solwaraspora sp. WMMD1047]MDG4829586.1 ATP-grasp domain-containing protein [Solwaraspora sp. WMMD1047]
MTEKRHHVLLVGGGNGAFRANRPETRTTFLTLRALLARFRGLDHHARVIAIQGDEPDEMLIGLARMIHATDPFDAVACLGEPLALLASRIAGALDLPGVPTPEVAIRIVDKERMRAHLVRAGLEEVRAYPVADVDELARIVTGGPEPAAWIVKPAAGSGSLGVSRVTAASDLAEAFHRAARPESPYDPDPGGRGVIVEPFLTGPQFSVESVSQGGVTSVLAITQKFSDPATFVELGHVVPAPISAAESDTIRDYVVALLDVLGVTDSVTHTELVLTPRGPRILETHARMGGDDIGEMASIVSGVNISAAAVELVLGESVQDRLANSQPSGTAEAVWFVASPEPGTFAGLDGVRDAEAVGSSVVVTELLSLGDPVEPLASSDSRVAQVRVSAASAKEAVALAQEAAKRLSLRIAKRVPADVGAHGTV